MSIGHIKHQLAQFMFGREEADAASESIASAYGLQRPHHLFNIIFAIQRFHTFHTDTASFSQADKQRLNSVKRELVSVVRYGNKIFAQGGENGVGSSILAVMKEPDVFSVYDFMLCMQSAMDVELASPRDPAVAALEAFVRPLCEYWASCSKSMSEAGFAGPELGYAPIPGTIGAFIVECLAVAGWSYSHERIAKTFAAVQPGVVLRFAGNETLN